MALNLLVPLPLGLMVASTHGSFGIVAAVLLCWCAGLLLFRDSIRLHSVFFRGGLVVAALQLIPFLHIASGLFGVLVWEHVVGKPKLREEDWSGGLAGFAITLLTAQPLLVAAWLFGGGIRMLFRTDIADSPDKADYADNLNAHLKEPESLASGLDIASESASE